MDFSEQLHRRILALESRERGLRVALIAVLCLLAGAIWMPRSQAQQPAAPLRVRGLIVEDGDGHDRILIGAPLGDGASGRTGIRINDANGVERMGLTLMNSGTMVFGLDAPPGKGDDRNRERITMVADDAGGAAVRLKDRRTYVVSSWYLDEQNRGWLEFGDFAQQPSVRRRVGLTGEETIKGAQ